MAIINKIDNIAKVKYGEVLIPSNHVSTLLLLPPTITKAVDKLVANIGDVLAYTVVVNNVTLSALGEIPFFDLVQDGATYIVDSFKVNGVSKTPIITANEITYTIPSIPALSSATITFQVRIVG